MSTFGLHARTAQHRPLEPYFLPAPRCPTQRPSGVSYLQTGDSFMVRAGWCFTTFSSCSLAALEQRVSGPTARRARSPDLNTSDFCICGHQNLLFVLQKAVTPTTCNNEYRMGLRRFVRHRNFPASQAITVQMCNVMPQRSRWTL